MERRDSALKLEKKSYYASRIKRAAHLLFFKHHKMPGVKGWELKGRLGVSYPRIISLLNSHLEKLDLKIKTVFEEGTPSGKPSGRELDRARFYVTLRGSLKPREARMMGWRIDDMAGLATTISTIIAHQGRASREEVEGLLREKLPKWRVHANVDRYRRAGYITEDEKGYLYLGWRTRAEVDEKKLVDSLLLEQEETSDSPIPLKDEAEVSNSLIEQEAD
ncbi:hypothetical protein KAH85_02985 [Candidatus Bathyarchaeota archaeon]|nr:hypothetical protein [Candidatus Bathyarchaeota archaeon]